MRGQGDERDERKDAERRLRRLRGWTQEQLAEAAGMQQGRISRYETGEMVPSRKSLERLAAAAGVAFPLVAEGTPALGLLASFEEPLQRQAMDR